MKLVERYLGQCNALILNKSKVLEECMEPGDVTLMLHYMFVVIESEVNKNGEVSGLVADRETWDLVSKEFDVNI